MREGGREGEGATEEERRGVEGMKAGKEIVQWRIPHLRENRLNPNKNLDDSKFRGTFFNDYSYCKS